MPQIAQNAMLAAVFGRDPTHKKMDIKKTLEIFDKCTCKYLRKEGNSIQGSLDAINWFNIDDTFNSTPKDELEFVDEDIKEYFKQPPAKEGFSNMVNSYFKGTPTMMQLVKELRTLNSKNGCNPIAIRKLPLCKNCNKEMKSIEYYECECGASRYSNGT